MEILIKVVQFFMSLSLLVAIHEFGHFIVARMFKIRVEKFYIFFDPWFSLFKWKRGDTEYGLGWLPLGGYVKIAGMIDESMDLEQMQAPVQPWEFRAKPAWQRFCVMVAGVVMNVLLAMLIYSGVRYTWGESYLANEDVKWGYNFNEAGERMGFKDGDKILSIDDQAIVDVNEIRQMLLLTKEDRRVVVERALLTGEIDAGILAELNDMEMYNHTHLFYEEFYAYVAREEELSAKSTIKSSELKGEMLWLLDEGHCFRDQMVRFCHINPERNDNLTYQLGSMETFMRMVERGEGITFVPELALDQMSDIQKQLVRPFAIPQPARKIVVLTDKRFIRHSLIDVLQTEIQASIPKSMLKLKPTQVAI